ncbi:MAG TPA: decarboxylating 6-phosphogluconate dehydrogenase [Dehalococcoidia bacterium]|nr:decarboxylating 6-phosphogluconate dehydrogenase [Dehalococcoidia bacterium]
MQVGLVGLGRMGAGIAARLRRHGHEVIGYDRDPALSEVASLEDLIGRLAPPRLVWVMVPAGDPTEQTIRAVADLLAPDDTIIDGGNSYYRDSRRRAEDLAARGLHFLDVGTSGGIWGLETGFCLMVGGPEMAFARAEPIFTALAPPGGYARVGPSGAGHYVKMVHNGIEYGLMQAYAEGFDLLQVSDFGLDVRQVAGLWNQGSVVRSWLLELAERAFERDPNLEELRGYVEDSGEGRWTVIEAVERGVPAGLLAQSLFSRFSSRQDNAFGLRVLAALRREFGGHAVRPAAGDAAAPGPTSAEPGPAGADPPGEEGKPP